MPGDWVSVVIGIQWHLYCMKNKNFYNNWRIILPFNRTVRIPNVASLKPGVFSDHCENVGLLRGRSRVQTPAGPTLRVSK